MLVYFLIYLASAITSGCAAFYGLEWLIKTLTITGFWRGVIFCLFYALCLSPMLFTAKLFMIKRVSEEKRRGFSRFLMFGFFDLAAVIPFYYIWDDGLLKMFTVWNKIFLFVVMAAVATALLSMKVLEVLPVFEIWQDMMDDNMAYIKAAPKRRRFWRKYNKLRDIGYSDYSAKRDAAIMTGFDPDNIK
jgi:hypothetical protein